MHTLKAFLVICIIICFGAIGVAMLAGLGLIPQSVYSLLYKTQQNLGLGGASAVPYLQKFEGYWDVTIKPSIAESEVGKCSGVDGSLQVHDGVFSGSLGPLGSSVGVHASTTEAGIVSGTFSTAGVRKATLSGKLRGTTGEGTWVDNYECRGVIEFTKTDPVVDPVQGHITSLTGEVTLFRGGQPRWAVPGQELYVGDRVEVAATGQATVVMGLGGQPTVVIGGATFSVPQPID